MAHKRKPAQAAEPTESSYKESPDSAEKTFISSTPVKSLEEATAAAGIDLNVWYVEWYECSTWSVPMKAQMGQDKTQLRTKDGRFKEALKWNPALVLQSQQFRVKVYLKRIMDKSQQVAFDRIFARMEKRAPRYPKLRLTAAKGEETMAVFCLFDVHFGRYAWAQETGEDYDLKIAETLYANAVEDLIIECKGKRITHVVLPIGNDFFHVDNRNNTTAAGTPQDVDGRYAKMIESGEMAVINAIEKLAGVASVEVVWVPGNHDFTASYHLARTVKAWFRNAEHIIVNSGPNPRKYIRWGATLIGLTHGNEEKHVDLPNIMANERPVEHGETTCREWLIGHLHKSKEYMTQTVNSACTTTIRVLKSLAGTDAWHHRKGYISDVHAAEVYFYGNTKGYTGHAVANARR